MGLRPLLFGVLAAEFLVPRIAQAGMPSPVVSDWAILRFETLSFFIFLLLVFAAAIRWLWNYLAKDFPAMPPLSYRRALALVVLVGLGLVIVLTMIAGARELLTPGAWQKERVLYRLGSSPREPEATKPAISPVSELDAPPYRDRTTHLRELQAALWQFAEKHADQLPSDPKTSLTDATLWNLPDLPQMQYIYVAGQKTGSQPPRIVVYEPDVYNGPRLVLYTDGTIRALPTPELRRQLQEVKP